MVNNLSTSSLPFAPGRLWQLRMACDSKESLSQHAADWHTPSPWWTNPRSNVHFLFTQLLQEQPRRQLEYKQRVGAPDGVCQKANHSPNSQPPVGGGAHPLTPAADTPLGSYRLWKQKLQPATAPKARNPSPCHLLLTSLDKHDWFLSDLAMVLLIAYWVTTPFVVQWETTVENTTKHPINNFWFFPLFLPMDNWF